MRCIKAEGSVERLKGLYGQFQDSRAYGFTSNPETGNRDGEFEAVRAGAAGIEEQNAVALSYRWTMGMAAYDDAEACRGRINFKFFYIVDDIDSDFPNLDDRRFRKLARPFTSVIVSSDSDDWSNRPQGLDYLGVPYIPGMDDQVRTTKDLNRLWSKQAVGI